ncbi:hypothetical protein A9Q84_11270 [Halobacteriovorax marinus]|mgnify:CR=1 FL=1|uniref:HTH lysR-type domain-containing protein n=1 Tax=Halobacteriovorax marinus TaxID=97084 RepID=A0A1Y5F7M4_9BACT|nr:hypothetical protein A9Q84_11270 [Halobacteriovorax marinus]
MELKEIRAFLILAQELNFRKAAERLNITQPPLTRQISNLEHHLGIKLFTRTTRKVELTGAGVHLVAEGEKLIKASELLESELRKLSKHKSATLKIGLNRIAFHSSMPHMLSSFKEQFPNTKIEISEESDSKILSQLNKGIINIAFSQTHFKKSDIEQLVVESQQLGFIVNKQHPLSTKKSLQLKDLVGHSLVFHGKADKLGFQSEFLSLLNQSNIKVKIYYKKIHESCENLAIINKGIILSTKRMASLSTNLAFIPLRDYSPKLKIYASWKTEDQSEELKVFINFFKTDISLPSSGVGDHF